MSKPLEGKVALVTGASRGIGAAIAQRLAAEGATVAITYSASPDKAKEVVLSIENAGGRALALQADSANPAAVKAAVNDTVKTFGQLDILVNNAGTLGRKGLATPLEEMTLDDFDELVSINIKGVFVAIQAALAHMGEGGRIINIGSAVNNLAGFPGATVYTMTKSAVAGLTRGLARDLGPKGITVNNVQPGPIDTDMNPAHTEQAKGFSAMVPLGRFGTVQEIAALVAFIAGPDAAYINGANLTADGGYTA